jgi:hypothetical protein
MAAIERSIEVEAPLTTVYNQGCEAKRCDEA